MTFCAKLQALSIRVMSHDENDSRALVSGRIRYALVANIRARGTRLGHCRTRTSGAP